MGHRLTLWKVALPHRCPCTNFNERIPKVAPVYGACLCRVFFDICEPSLCSGACITHRTMEDIFTGLNLFWDESEETVRFFFSSETTEREVTDKAGKKCPSSDMEKAYCGSLDHVKLSSTLSFSSGWEMCSERSSSTYLVAAAKGNMGRRRGVRRRRSRLHHDDTRGDKTRVPWLSHGGGFFEECPTAPCLLLKTIGISNWSLAAPNSFGVDGYHVETDIPRMSDSPSSGRLLGGSTACPRQRRRLGS